MQLSGPSAGQALGAYSDLLGFDQYQLCLTLAPDAECGTLPELCDGMHSGSGGDQCRFAFLAYGVSSQAGGGTTGSMCCPVWDMPLPPPSPPMPPVGMWVVSG
jgi:hypothetical protein